MSGFDSEGLDAVPARASEAAAALAALREPAQGAARAIDEAFSSAGTSLARSLSRAAADGKISLAELAQAVIAAVNAAAGSGGGGLGEALGAVLKSTFAGTRAEGGPVSAGGTYLVGERGPELFRPAGAGTIEPAGASGGVHLTIQVQGGDVAGLARSDAQLAQALARAVSLGARGL